MKSKLKAYSITTEVQINGKVYGSGKCNSAGEAQTAAAEEEFRCQLGELKIMYEDLIGFAEAMLEQSKNCLRQIQMSKFGCNVEKSCEDLIAAISDHRENLVKDLRFVEANIVTRGGVITVSNRVQN